MKTINNLEELQVAELELLEKMLQVFDEEKIKYFVIGGTLLGAVRHGGFIPWDDDIDIAVPREDYKRLISVMHRLDDKDVEMKYYKDDNSLYYYPIKIVNKKYEVNEKRSNSKVHPWIDILPLDGAPSGIKARFFYFKMLYYRLLLGLHYVDQLRDIDRNFLQKFIIKIGKITKIGQKINPTYVKDKIDATLSKNNLQDCYYAGTCMGAYFFKEIVPKSYFGVGRNVIFEGLEVRAPEKIDRYLTHMYGDYMKPPKETNKSGHIN